MIILKVFKVLKAIYKVFRVLLTIVLVALLAIVLTQRFTDNKMSIAGIRIFTVVTESMVPDYVVGDAILVKSVEPSELQVGDDITYQGEKDSFEDKIVTHRIIEINKDKDNMYKITTQGIANDEPDPEINETQVYGRVLYKIKTISYINGIIGNLYGMYFAIIVPMAIMIFIEFIGYKKDKHKEKDEEKNIEENDNSAANKADKKEKKIKKKDNKKEDNKESKKEKDIKQDDITINKEENTKTNDEIKGGKPKSHSKTKEEKEIEKRKQKRQARKDRIRKKRKV